MKTKTYTISSKKNFEITVGTGILKILSHIVDITSYSRIGVIVDTNVKSLYLDKIIAAVKTSKNEIVPITVAAGEQTKTMTQATIIHKELLKNSFDKKSVLIALGGGVVSDITGFVASTYMRGIDWIAIPTTLVSQVDAAIGGKTGVNFKRFKNLIGAFHQPKAIVCDAEVLKTLSSHAFISGLGETIKYAATLDKKLFEYFEKKKTRQFSQKELSGIITTCTHHKATIVAMDEKDITGTRAVLNFGHTVGHAIEALEHTNRIAHGHAIAIGMVAATHMSTKVTNLSTQNAKRIINVVEKYGLPTTYKGKPEKILEKIKHDKKTENEIVKWVLLSDIGTALPSQVVGEKIVLEALSEVCI